MRRYRTQSGTRTIASSALAIALWAIVSLMAAMPARASVAVLVEEPYGSIAGMAPTGHSAIYFDHICAASPTSLRPCREDEMGAVVSRYNNVGGYDWLAMPLVAYLYAVDSVDDIPARMDAATEFQMRDAYRRAHLLMLAPNQADGSAPQGNWYQLAGSAYDRTIYGFQVKTTTQQEERLIALFNDRKNKERYNGAFRNCADFARVTINRFYPHAIRRNFIADLGMTTPKQVAHALSRYSEGHPEVELATFRVPQVPGSLPRSEPIKGAMESLLTRKRYVLPITAMQPVATAVMFVAYMGTGRFAMPKDAPLIALRPVANVNGLEVAGAEEELPVPAGTVKTSFAEETVTSTETER